MVPRHPLLPAFHARSADWAARAAEADHATSADTATDALQLAGRAPSTYADTSALSGLDGRVQALESQFRIIEVYGRTAELSGSNAFGLSAQCDEGDRAVGGGFECRAPARSATSSGCGG